MLADHVPVVSVLLKGNTQKSLFDQLVAKLNDKGFRVAVIMAGELDRYVARPLSVQRAVCLHDVVFVLNGLEWLNGRLFFRPAKGLDQEPKPARVYWYCVDQDAVGQCAEQIEAWLDVCTHNTPVYGGVLIGGKSSRMGRPKHLLIHKSGYTWLERTVQLLNVRMARVLLVGAGNRPETLNQLERIVDRPGIGGPMAGILSAMAEYPFVSWLFAACDMPEISLESVDWLLAQRRPGRVAIVPHNPLTGKDEPLFAWYDFRCKEPLVSLVADGERRMSRLASIAHVYKPVIPDHLVSAWNNINSPSELNS